MGKNIQQCHDQSEEESITLAEHIRRYHPDSLNRKLFPKALYTLDNIHLSRAATPGEIVEIMQPKKAYAHPLEKFRGKGGLCDYSDEDLKELQGIIADEINEWQSMDNSVQEEFNRRAEKWMQEHPNDI